MGNRKSGQGLRMFLELGFRLALLYGGLGLTLEVLHRHLPPELYRDLSGALSALPAWLLESLGLKSTLTAALAHGQLPGWVVGATLPLIGVAAIFALSLGLGLMWSFGGALASLKDRA